MLFCSCLTELSPTVEKCTNLSFPGLHGLQSPLPPLCLLLIIVPSPTVCRPGRDHGELQISTVHPFWSVCSIFCNFPALVGSTHPSALQLHHREFFTRGKLSLVIATCIRRDVFFHELFDMQYNHSFCSEKLTLNRMV